MSAFNDRFGIGFMEHFGATSAAFEQEGLLTTTDGHCRLTPRGMLLLDTIAAAFIDCIAVSHLNCHWVAQAVDIQK